MAPSPHRFVVEGTVAVIKAPRVTLMSKVGPGAAAILSCGQLPCLEAKRD
jgi:hypothetical protein